MAGGGVSGSAGEHRREVRSSGGRCQIAPLHKRTVHPRKKPWICGVNQMRMGARPTGTGAYSSSWLGGAYQGEHDHHRDTRIPERQNALQTSQVLFLNRSCVTGLPTRPTEQKPAKTFEQKVAKATKGLGSTIYGVVLQACLITVRHHLVRFF